MFHQTGGNFEMKKSEIWKEFFNRTLDRETDKYTDE